MSIRTDLALEEKELKSKDTSGIDFEENSIENIKITRIRVLNKAGEKSIGKPRGDYVTVEIPNLESHGGQFDLAAEIIAKELKGIAGGVKNILVIGIGNSQITPDALGPKVAEGILATRHISSSLKKELGLENLNSVSVLSPGVLGQTGIELYELIAGAVQTVKPDLVIAVDALAARRLSRLGCTVQISNTGITPGSGVDNARREISIKTLNVPVVAVGIPTVVDAHTLISDLGGTVGADFKESENMIVTPKGIDLMIDRAAELLSFSLNTFLQPQLDKETLRALV
ncbi:MAG: GPR endopeptidase [Clostridia bacterium]|nr:GPR endopeptidase [Clostridia bacterium]